MPLDREAGAVLRVEGVPEGVAAVEGIEQQRAARGGSDQSAAIEAQGSLRLERVVEVSTLAE